MNKLSIIVKSKNLKIVFRIKIVLIVKDSVN